MVTKDLIPAANATKLPGLPSPALAGPVATLLTNLNRNARLRRMLSSVFEQCRPIISDCHILPPSPRCRWHGGTPRSPSCADAPDKSGATAAGFFCKACCGLNLPRHFYHGFCRFAGLAPLPTASAQAVDAGGPLCCVSGKNHKKPSPRGRFYHRTADCRGYRFCLQRVFFGTPKPH